MYKRLMAAADNREETTSNDQSVIRDTCVSSQSSHQTNVSCSSVREVCPPGRWRWSQCRCTQVLDGLLCSSAAAVVAVAIVGRVTPSGRWVDRDRDVAQLWPAPDRLIGSGLGLGLPLDGDVLTDPPRVLTIIDGDDGVLRDDDGGTTSRVLCCWATCRPAEYCCCCCWKARSEPCGTPTDRRPITPAVCCPRLAGVVTVRSGDSVVTWMRISGCRRGVLGDVTAGDCDDAPNTTAANDRSTPPSTAPANVDCPAPPTPRAADVWACNASISDRPEVCVGERGGGGCSLSIRLVTWPELDCDDGRQLTSLSTGCEHTELDVCVVSSSTLTHTHTSEAWYSGSLSCGTSVNSSSTLFTNSSRRQYKVIERERKN